ncbi:MAG TPA: arginase family protein, partial [Puia sp.]|nr:arginase family protein [Puia sp.]
LVIIEAPSNLGLMQLTVDREPGVRKLPDWLRMHSFHAQIHPDKVIRVEPPPYSMDLDEEAGVRNADKIILFSKELSQELQNNIELNLFSLVIGGDCSILIGCGLGLKSLGQYGLIFIDGHTDFILPHNSFTKGAAGMDLAIVNGKGHEKLTNIEGKQPYFKEQNVFVLGNRYFNEDFVKPIRKSAIHYFDLIEIRKKGLELIVDEFLGLVKKSGLDGFWIHFDVDVLNNDIMPAVDSPQEDGLNYGELKELLKPLLHSPMAVGMDITILDPDLDHDGSYTKDFVKNMVSIITGRG